MGSFSGLGIVGIFAVHVAPLYLDGRRWNRGLMLTVAGSFTSDVGGRGGGGGVPRGLAGQLRAGLARTGDAEWEWQTTAFFAYATKAYSQALPAIFS